MKTLAIIAISLSFGHGHHGHHHHHAKPVVLPIAPCATFTASATGVVPIPGGTGGVVPVPICPTD